VSNSSVCVCVWGGVSPPTTHSATAPSGSGRPHYRGFTITLRHATLGRTPLNEGSARRRDLYLTTHNNHKRQTSMSPAGFEPAIPASKRPQAHWNRPCVWLHPKKHPNLHLKLSKHQAMTCGAEGRKNNSTVWSLGLHERQWLASRSDHFISSDISPIPTE
jgi:hypothetical protein